MFRKTLYAASLASASLLAPALGLSVGLAPAAHAAGKGDRAQAAIAEADGKIQAAQTAGVATELPERMAKATEILANAREAVSAGHKEDAITLANQASAMADASIGEAQRHKAERMSAANAHAGAMAAEANQRADAAQAQAAEANARAENAEQAAQVSAQQAQAAQTAAVVAASTPPAPAEPAEVKTTVTTRNVTTHAAVRHHVVHHRATHRPASSVAQTTTTVTQKVN